MGSSHVQTFPRELQVVLENTTQPVPELLPSLAFMLLDRWCSC